MNNLEDISQTASIDWSAPRHSMLHEIIGIAGTEVSEWRSYDNSMFEEMETQVRANETEFRSVLSEVKTKFIWRDPSEVEEFLKQHRGIAPQLLEALPHLSLAFGQDTLFALEVLREETPVRTIYALVLWMGDRSTARAALRRFDEEWLEENSRKIGGTIVFDYELV